MSSNANDLNFKTMLNRLMAVSAKVIAIYMQILCAAW